MSEVTVFGFGLVLLMLSWRYVWKPTALDHVRDKLFDLRDHELRDFYVSRDLPFEDPTYQALRALINRYLRFTETVSFYAFVFTLFKAEQYPDNFKQDLASFEAQFATNDPEILRVVTRIRSSASNAMFEYMIETSLIPMGLVVILMPFFRLKVSLGNVKSFILGRLTFAQITTDSLATSFLQASKSLHFAPPESARMLLEKCSYKA